MLAPAMVASFKDEVDLALLIGLTVCHQSVGLIARALEAAGIATLSLSSTAPLRSRLAHHGRCIPDYPLARPGARRGWMSNVKLWFACEGFENMEQPGNIVDLPMRWSRTMWKDIVLRPHTENDGELSDASVLAGDQHGPATPRYHTEDGRRQTQTATCIFLPQD